MLRKTSHVTGVTWNLKRNLITFDGGAIFRNGQLRRDADLDRNRTSYSRSTAVALTAQYIAIETI